MYECIVIHEQGLIRHPDIQPTTAILAAGYRAEGDRDRPVLGVRCCHLVNDCRELDVVGFILDFIRNDHTVDVAALDLEEAGRRFITLANDRGGKDNITAVIVEAV